MAEPRKAAVLVVDQNARACRALVEWLNDRGHDAVGVDSGEQAFNRLDAQPWDALVAELYDAELDDLDAAADALLAEHPAAVAFRRWVDRYAEFVATKQGMRQALRAPGAVDAVASGPTRARITAVVDRLLTAGAADGTLRTGVLADDVTATLVGVFLATSQQADPDQRRRIFDIVTAGLRAGLASEDRAGQ